MTVQPGDGITEREIEIEALVVDRYLESLLARRPAGLSDVPADLIVFAALSIAALASPMPGSTATYLMFTLFTWSVYRPAVSRSASGRVRTIVNRRSIEQARKIS